MELHKEVKIMTYNIGNCLYGRNANNNSYMTFSRKKINSNIKGQLSQIKKYDPDILLLQEIGTSSLSNTLKNIYKKYRIELKKYKSKYYNNYNILQIFNNGKATFIKKYSQNQKIKIPFKVRGILNNIFCSNKVQILTRIKISDTKKELIIINIHLTAYKKNHIERIKQLNYILDIAKKELDKGNYVVIGGDWNIDLFSETNKLNLPSEIIKKINNDNWTMNAKGKTLKYEGKLLKDDKTYDGFLTSKNIVVTKLKSYEQFDYSDHSPVTMTIKLNEESMGESKCKKV